MEDKETRIGKPKGLGKRIGIIVTIGVPNIVHYYISLPQRVYKGEELYVEWDFPEKEKGKIIGRQLKPHLSASENVSREYIQNKMTRNELLDVLKFWGIKITRDNHDNHDDNDNLHEQIKDKEETKNRYISYETAVERVLHLQQFGRVGLPKSGRKELGGPKIQPINTALDVARYFREQFEPQLSRDEKKLIKNHCLVLDNASSHGAPQTNQPNTKSFLENEFKDQLHIIRGGLIFTPPRSPDKNPVELVFSWIKTYIRKQAPPEGFTEESLVQCIHSAFRHLKEKINDEQFLIHWCKKCGYTTDIPKNNLKGQHNCGYSSSLHNKDDKNKIIQNCRTPSNLLTKKGHMICADSRGTIIKEKPKGKNVWIYRNDHQHLLHQPNENDLEDINIVNKIHQIGHPQNEPTRHMVHRYPGYGPRPKIDESEYKIKTPKSYQSAVIGNDNYEVKAIVNERFNHDKNNKDYCLYWADHSRSWVNENDLTAGKQALIHAWKYQQKRRLDMMNIQKNLLNKQEKQIKSSHRNNKKNSNYNNHDNDDDDHDDDYDDDHDNHDDHDDHRGKKLRKNIEHNEHSDMYEVKRLLDYNPKTKMYKIDWADGPNGEKYEPTWQNANTINEHAKNEYWNSKNKK
jgi:transposase